MEETPKLQTLVDIKPTPHSVPRISAELTAEESVKEQRIPFPFFRPLSQRKENTWIISIFVILHLISFTATMFVNDCWGNSHAQCALKSLGRFSFQPLAENPLLGPSASALDSMGALHKRYLVKGHQPWRLLTSSCLHGGVFHIIISLSSVIFVGIHLEQEFGPLRTGLIYILSALMGSLVAALFIQDRASVTSSGALFGLLGALLSGLIRNWKIYSKKFATLVLFSIILTLNTIVGLMPYVNNFSNIGGFISGFLTGFMLLLKPELGKVYHIKGFLIDYDAKNKVQHRHKFDKPVLRSVSLVIFSLVLAGVTVAIVQGVNLNKYCSWCRYIDCVPLKWWSCDDITMPCEVMTSSEQLTLTCSGNGKFRVLPSANVSEARIQDLCYLICS
ncbi:inactive RHOMBOID-like protein 8 [Primulina tabacum]|uniref:inactive RHOMBOID-like protein 8 n=1 Tax=Primulina tabacum TaxID=48773 RepID=UPI003F5A5A2F